jgi:rubrerythrin
MKRIYEAADVIEAEAVAAVLKGRGIDAFVVGAHTYDTPGVNPLAFPAVWIADEEDEGAARLALAGLRAADKGAPWRCPACGEAHEGQFAACWKCGAPRER